MQVNPVMMGSGTIQTLGSIKPWTRDISRSHCSTSCLANLVVVYGVGLCTYNEHSATLTAQILLNAGLHGTKHVSETLKSQIH
jgi:hypothetical protein